MKKINKGLILTIIVLAILTIYLIGLENQRKADKEEIKDTISKIADITSQMVVYPEDMQRLDKEITKEQKEKYEKEIKEKLEEIMIENEEAVDLQHKVIITNLENGNKNGEIRTKFNRNIKKIKGYEFNGEQVTVSFQSNIEEEFKYNDDILNEEKVRKNNFDTSYGEVTLKKVDGKWKMVYSNLQYSNSMMYF